MVGVPNFMTKSAPAAGTAGTRQAKATAAIATAPVATLRAEAAGRPPMLIVCCALIVPTLVIAFPNDPATIMGRGPLPRDDQGTVAKGRNRGHRRDMSEVGLKKNAISFASNVVISVASTAPAYSLAAALPGLVVAAKFGVPAILIVAFVPMLFIAVAHYHFTNAA